MSNIELICHTCLKKRNIESEKIEEKAISQIDWKIVNLKKLMFLCDNCQKKRNESLKKKKQNRNTHKNTELTTQERNALGYINSHTPNSDGLFFWNNLCDANTSKKAVNRLTAKGILVFDKEHRGWKLVKALIKKK